MNHYTRFLVTCFGFLLPLLAADASTIRLSQLDLGHVDSLRFPTAPPPKPDVSVSGQPIVIAGRTFAHGLATRGITRLEIELDGRAVRLHAWLGFTDDSKERGPVWFEVVGDGRMLFAGEPVHRGEPAHELSLDLTGLHTVVLLVQSPDHLDNYTAWAEATIEYAGAAPKTVAHRAEPPQTLTPAAPATPRINGARVYGVRPGSPVIFLVAASGERPMNFSATGLPVGLTLDAATGKITGTVSKPGEYPVKLTARNARGAASRELRIVVGDTIALTPPMGWNSWNCFAQDVTADDVRAATDAFIAAGLVNHGWSYINIDDFWMTRPTPSDPIWNEIATRAKARGIAPMKPPPADDPTLIGPARDPQGRINPNARFADMPALVEYVHARGLKIGIYSSPGPLTCGRCVGSLGYEELDAARYAEWGFDYLKYDWCGYRYYAPDNSRAELMKPYTAMGVALRAQPRDIVYSLCQYGMGDVWEWGAEVHGNVWRTTRDILDTWPSMAGIGFSQNGHQKFAGPGRWNDPDMLVVGQVGWGRNVHPTALTPDEQYTHLSLWCLQSAPLLIGCDLTKLDPFTLSLLTNDEVLAVNQDPLGRPAGRIRRDRNLEVWSRPLADGSIAVGLFNRGELPATVTGTWADLGLAGAQHVRDLWRQQDIGVASDNFSALVPRHGVVLVKLSPVQ